MHITNKNFKLSSFSNLEFSLFALIVSSIGSFIQIWGGSWDVTSHLLNEPESFFTPSHTVLYTGISLIVISAIAGSILLTKKEIKNNTISLAFKLLIVGSILSIIAGPADYFWHEKFGLDGLLSPTHIILVTGILINSLAVVIGLCRILNLVPSRKRLVQIFLVPAFSALWYTSIWYVFLFVLPISETDSVDFNLDPFIAIIIASITLPLINSIMFQSSARAFNNIFASAFLITAIMISMNIFTNILPPKGLLTPILPLYLVVCLGASLLSDILLNSNFFKIISSTNNNKNIRYNRLLAAAIMGSIFYFCTYPMITWTYAPAFDSEVRSINGVLPTFLNTIPILSVLTVIVGAVIGMIGYILFLKKIENWFHLQQKNEHINMRK